MSNMLTVTTEPGRKEGAASQLRLSALVTPKEALTVQQVEEKILSDCALIGLDLPKKLNKDAVPRFSCPINKIEYEFLISKAYHFSRMEEQERQRQSKLEQMNRVHMNKMRSCADTFELTAGNNLPSCPLKSSKTSLIDKK